MNKVSNKHDDFAKGNEESLDNFECIYVKDTYERLKQKLHVPIPRDYRDMGLETTLTEVIIQTRLAGWIRFRNFHTCSASRQRYSDRQPSFGKETER